MSAIRPALLALLATAWPAAAIAQVSTPVAPAWTPEISVATGLSHVFRWDDQTYGDTPALGVGGALAHRSGWAVDFSVDRAIGLEPRLAPCGLIDITCVGRAREGPQSVMVGTLAVVYRFDRPRLQPYLIAGLGLLRSRSFHSLTQVQGATAVVTEFESSDRGFGPDLGAGLRLKLHPRLAAAAEIRWLDAPWRSRENLAATRLLLRLTARLRE